MLMKKCVIQISKNKCKKRRTSRKVGERKCANEKVKKRHGADDIGPVSYFIYLDEHVPGNSNT